MEYARATQDSDTGGNRDSGATTLIPVIGTGMQAIESQIREYRTQVIKACLYEALNAEPADALRMLEIAHAYLSEVTADAVVGTGTRVQWNSGYSEYKGTVVQRMGDGSYMVVPTGSEVYLQPDEFAGV